MYFFAVVGKEITFGRDDWGIVTISKFLFSVSLFPAPSQTEVVSRGALYRGEGER